jgi:hypothetical protein
MGSATLDTKSPSPYIHLPYCRHLGLGKGQMLHLSP